MQVSPTQLPWRTGWSQERPASTRVPPFHSRSHSLFLPNTITHLCPSPTDSGRTTLYFCETHQMEPRLHRPRILGRQEASACLPRTARLAVWPLRPREPQGTGAGRGERSPCRSVLLTVSEPTSPRGH